MTPRTMEQACLWKKCEHYTPSLLCILGVHASTFAEGRHSEPVPRQGGFHPTIQMCLGILHACSLPKAGSRVRLGLMTDNNITNALTSSYTTAPALGAHNSKYKEKHVFL